MYNTILVPLDGSKRAERILPHVEDLAQRFGAEVVFLRVIDPVPYLVGPDGAFVALQEQELGGRTTEAEAYLCTLVARFEGKGIKAHQRIDLAPTVQAIVDASERENADLIAIASHGRSGLSRFFYGSVAAGVLHRADRPLLLIRSSDKEWSE